MTAVAARGGRRNPPAAPAARGSKRPGRAGVRVRRATIADAATLARIRRASVRGLAAPAYGSAQLAAWARLGPVYDAWALGPGGEVAFVAERGGRAVGFGALRPEPRAEVTSVFVLPGAARGGVGTALLARLEAEARRRGATRVVVEASLNGEPFYRARGYRGGRAIHVPLPDGASLEAVRLSKRL